MKKTREFWAGSGKKLSRAKKSCQKEEIFNQNLIKRHGIRLTSGEIFNLPFNEERMNLEKEMLKEYMSYNDNIQATKIQKVFKGFMVRKYYFKRQHENMIREFQIKRSTKIIKREWKIFRFQLQMKRYVKEMKDRVLTRIQKVLRGFKVWNDTGTLRTMARMNALRKTLFLRMKRNKAAKTIQRWFRKYIMILRKVRKEHEEYLKWLLVKQTEDEKIREMRFDPSKFKIVNRGGIIKRVNIDEEKERNKRMREKEKLEKENQQKKKKNK